jgi:hypothetical protein
MRSNATSASGVGSTRYFNYSRAIGLFRGWKHGNYRCSRDVADDGLAIPIVPDIVAEAICIPLSNGIPTISGGEGSREMPSAAIPALGEIARSKAAITTP